MNFDEISVQGVFIKDYTFVGVAAENEEAWKDIFYKSGSSIVLPSRNLNTIKIRPNTPKSLGVVISSKFTSDSGDVFDINIAFPLCSNDFVVEEFTKHANEFEEKRKRNSAELAKYFATLKENAATFILQTETLANLIDDKIDNETKLEELRNINSQLENQRSDLEKALKADEAAELIAERKSAQACLDTKIASFSIQSNTHSKAILQEHRQVLKEQLDAGIAFTDVDRVKFDELIKKIGETVDSLNAINPTKEKLTIANGKAVNPDDLIKYFFSN